MPMNPLVWIPLLTQLVIPVGLLLWLARRSDRSRSAWWLEAVFVASYILAIALAGLWLTLPWYLPLIYGGLFLAALVRGRPRGAWWPANGRAWLALTLRAVAAVLSVGVVVYALAGYRPPAEPVDLAFPLRSGTYLVVNGGANTLINAHPETLTLERARPYRGQSYGVDIVALDEWGWRADGLAPTDPAAYAIFGHTIHAPCAGSVVAAVDGQADLPPPQVDRDHMAGNHVILDCAGRWIVLGHMQQGSVQVVLGDEVATGEPLGRVGNTGNTGEPHLHIHAQRPGSTDMPLGGEPLPITLGGRYLTRNARVTVGD